MKIKDIKRTPKHITSIGGQALIEGVMMRGPKKISMAVRKPDKEIEIKTEKLNTLGMRNSFFRLPFLRGVVGLIEAMVFGTKALIYSADFFEEDGQDGKEGILDKLFKDKAEDVGIFLTISTSILLSLFFFMILPTSMTSIFRRYIESPILLNLLEGFFRIVVFSIYLLSISKMEDIKRVFQYHGAEHKSIHCYENDEELTVENIKKYPILHPRCGTSFLFMVMIVSIIVLSFFGWPNPLQRFITRAIMLPVIAGISYEINRLIGKSDSKLSYYFSYPGLMIQKMATVKEPDDQQIEVAIEALQVVLTDDREEDLWK